MRDKTHHLWCGDRHGDVHEVAVNDLLALDDSVYSGLFLQGIRARLQHRMHQLNEKDRYGYSSILCNNEIIRYRYIYGELDREVRRRGGDSEPLVIINDRLSIPRPSTPPPHPPD
jgi:hypothetical protein